MRFLDEVVITVRSGDGGRGCVSFRRERFIPKGGPDGGDGGDGGNVILRATKALHTLYDFAHRSYFRAKNGAPGKGKNQTGKKGEDLVLKVPVGTIVYDDQTNQKLGDLTKEGQEMIVVPGGKGGKGNTHFATSTNRAPRIAQPGTPGVEQRLRLVLKFLADVGLVGLPNVGKSTLLASLTNAQPKIEDYPFTTVVPNLGVLEVEEGKTVVLADIPGLIEGASQGKGLGLQFLKHVERTKVLVHVLDITHLPKGDLLEDLMMLTREIAQYNQGLLHKTQLVLINKMDLYSVESRDLNQLQRSLEKIGLESIPISALRGDGLDQFRDWLSKRFP